MKSKTDTDSRPLLEIIQADSERMLNHTIEWSRVNTHSLNPDGIRRLSGMVSEAFAPLASRISSIELPDLIEIDSRGRQQHTPLAPCLAIQGPRRLHALRLLFMIHLDTVYPSDGGFDSVQRREGGILHGPGVADAKGGMAVIHQVLSAIEQSPLAARIEWQVFLNTDEELGSPGSMPLMPELARSADFGLLYEPALPDGSLIANRKGSGNFTLLIKGRAAHAGREFFAGRSAIHLAAQAVVQLAEMSSAANGTTINVGSIDGGGPVNVVADIAVVRFNARVRSLAAMHQVQSELQALTNQLNANDGFTAQLFGEFSSPPKLVDQKTAALLQLAQGCATTLGIPLELKDSGGVCDGNKLLAGGLPNIDTLGVRGRDIHSHNEIMWVDSLVERAQLSLLLVESLVRHKEERHA
ncbi:MAG: hydrolase [Leptospiraceae bacterium]|nr:hydrolase [Leptospiraceae bacterium]